MLPTLSYYVFKHRVNKKGETNIYLRITNNRISSYLSMKIAVPYKSWDASRQRVKSNYPLANITNLLLERKLYEHRENLMKSSLTIENQTAKAVKRKMTDKRLVRFFDLADDYIRILKTDGKIGTADKCKTILNKFELFLGTKSCTFLDIDHNTLDDYVTHLKEKYKNSTNTVHTNLKFLRRVFNIAVKKGIIEAQNNPFSKVELKLQKTTRPFLTEEELLRIIGLNLKDDLPLRKSRDILIWSVLSGGLRISDLLMLRKLNIEGEYINIIIKKTKTPHRIKMSTKAQEIINRYLADCKHDTHFVFGLLDNDLDLNNAVEVDRQITNATTIYNKSLKTIAAHCGISKNVSSHISRVTFTTLAVKNGISLSVVQNILKHSKPEMTLHYSKLVNSELDLALEKFQNYVAK